MQQDGIEMISNHHAAKSRDPVGCRNCKGSRGCRDISAVLLRRTY